MLKCSVDEEAPMYDTRNDLPGRARRFASVEAHPHAKR